MKKLLISLGSVLALAFIALFFLTASNAGQDQDKKVKSEVKKEQVTSHCSSACNHGTAGEIKNAESG